jgi:phosphoribosylglycinamide formyltransferase-1
MKRLSIFVSGNGTNLQRIAEYFANNKDVEIVNVVCNNPKAYSIERAKNLDIPLRMITKQDFNSEAFIKELQSLDIDLIVLAGFLWKLPENLVKAFPKKIVNIHPALLPKYGGKGMWGHHVHEAVKAAGETETGVTVHWVTPVCDAGEIIAQFRVALSPEDTVDDIAEKEHQLEMQHFPKVVEEVIQSIQ